MRKNFLLAPLVLLLGMTISTVVFAQVAFNKRATGSIGVVPQPGNLLNDASLDNIDFQNGTLRVGIPLYTIKVDDIIVPISLSYNALGIKVGQAASSVGMGWELNAGGKITTIVNGLPDSDSKGLGQWDNPNPMTSLFSTGSFDVTNNSTHREFAVNALNNKKDGAWDAYAYSTPISSGKFMVTGGNKLTYPYDPTITINNQNSITSGEGITYTYGQGDIMASYKRSFHEKNSQGGTVYSETWKPSPNYENRNLSVITSKWTDQTINFNYESIVENTSQADDIRLRNKSITTTMVTMPMARDVHESGGTWFSASNSFLIKEPSYSQNRTEIINHTRLSNIVYNFGRVSFVYGADLNGQDVLNTIIIEQKTESGYAPLKKFSFVYDIQNGSHYLRQLLVTDANDVLINKWGFSYNGSLPVAWNALTYAQDRWGFYNAQVSNQTLMESPAASLVLNSKVHYPVYDIGNTDVSAVQLPRTSQESRFITLGNAGALGISRIPFANRDFVFAEAIKGTLNKITTPTGGTVIYEYEPHRFQHTKRDGGSSIVQSKDGGGIRIKSVMFKNGEENYTKKEYTYGRSPADGESGYGKVAYPGTFLMSRAIYGQSNNSFDNMVMFSHPLNDMDYGGGSYAGYGYVTEYVVKDSTAYYKNHSKTTYEYVLPSFDFWDTSSMPGYFYNSYGVNPERIHEKLLRCTKYKILSGGSYDKVEENINTYYSPFKAPTPSVPQKSYSYFGSVIGTLYSQYTGTDYTVCFVEQLGPGTSPSQSCSGETVPVVADPLYWTHFVDETPESYFPGKYGGGPVEMSTFSTCIRLKQNQVITYETNAAPIDTVITNYYYENPKHMLLTRTAGLDSRGDSVINRTYYPGDFMDAGSTTAMFNSHYLRLNGILSIPIHQLSGIKRNNIEYILSGSQDNSVVRLGPDFVHGEVMIAFPSKLNTSGKMLTLSEYLDNYNTLFEKEMIGEGDNGKIQNYQDKAGRQFSVVYGYNLQLPIAKVKGEYLSEIAYTSFESIDGGSYPYGYLNFNLSGIQNTDTPMGKKAYNLTYGDISRDYINRDKPQILSYWTRDDGSILNISTYIYSATSQSYVSAGTVSTEDIKRRKDGWKFVERKLTGVDKIVISGNGFIDELRQYPSNAEMVTYTYDPTIGITSSNDAKGMTTYYEYDAFMRLKHIKDQDGNIVKAFDYHFKSL
ncbi:YD repeat-containing protein [Pedobacter sp. W3I1]|uniref:hypothetical protein n=1 Tax=Pedobacter sp. W3I1 TaxID=3042291 RepID=UPI0027896D2C|nr:hypothetical protein [Pedobacter sp. W3I1]MDQ0638343.1 YD repeat-containing protein [Pedobacter sp. W3I1]